jgi:peptidoglycan/LPS O-acetylase OafA/YrhL
VVLSPFSIELFFGVLGGRAAPENKRSIFLGAVVFFTLASLALRLGVGKSANWASQMRMIVVYRFDALMFGVALAVVKLESIGWWNRLLRLWPLGVGLLAAAVIIAHRSMLVAPPMMPAAWLLVIFPLGCAMILPRCTRLESTEDWKATIVGCVSKWSYSIYLCHLPILATLLREMHDDQCGLIGKLLVRSAALFLTLGCSSLLFVYLEQPILTFAPKDRY